MMMKKDYAMYTNYTPVWDFLLLSLGGCWLKMVQAFLNGVVMVFFQEAIWVTESVVVDISLWICCQVSLQWMCSLGLI